MRKSETKKRGRRKKHAEKKSDNKNMRKTNSLKEKKSSFLGHSKSISYLKKFTIIQSLKLDDKKLLKYTFKILNVQQKNEKQKLVIKRHILNYPKIGLLYNQYILVMERPQEMQAIAGEKCVF